VVGGTGSGRDGADFAPAELLGELPDVVTLLEPSGVIGYVTPSVEHVLGLLPGQLIGHRACEFLDGDSRRNGTAWLALAQTAELPGLVHRVIRADGSLAGIETRLRVMRRRGRPAQVLAVSRDISASAAAEQEVEERAQVWDGIVDLISEGVLVLDEDGVVLAANRAAAGLLRAEPDELRGAPARKFLAASVPGGPGRVLVAGGLRLRTSTEFAVAPRRRGCTAPLRGRAAVLPPPHRPGHAPNTVLILEEASRPVPGIDLPPAAGNDALSPREVAVLRLLADGRDVRAIAGELGLSIHTVRAYVKSILRKLDVRTQLQAVIVSARAGVLDLS
jgi:PAS domain S-box-containing protein